MGNCQKILAGITILVCLLIPVTSQAKTRISCYMPQPPEVNLGGFRKLAVQNFSGASIFDEETGQYLTSKLIKYLTHPGMLISTNNDLSRTDETPVKTFIKLDSSCAFQVLDRARLYQEFSRQWTDRSTLEPELAVEIGKFFDIDYIIYGSCRVSAMKNKNLNTHSNYGKGGQVTSYPAWCFTNKAELRITFSLVNARTGDIIKEKEINRSSQEEVCDDEDRMLVPITQMVEALADSSARELAAIICPCFEIEEFQLEDVKTAGHREEIKTTFQAVEMGEPERARAILERLESSYPDNHALLYDLGVLCEMTGAFEKARQYYDRSLSVRDMGSCREARILCEKRVTLDPFYNQENQNKGDK